MMEPERDGGFERLIARAAHGAGAADDCPDVETIAAWSDDVLHGPERARVETHVSACARCQMQLAAMARMAQPGEHRAADARRFGFARRSWWLVPVAGAVAAAGLWFIVQPTPVVPPPPSAKQVPAPAPQEPPAPMRDQAQSTATDAAVPDLRRRLEKPQAVPGAVAGSAPAAPPPPAPSAPPAPMSAPAEERTEMSAARAANAAGINRLTVARTEDGRVTWDPKSSPLLAQVTAGASPTPGVIWLAGRAGLILLTTDRQSWRRLAFPEPVDLTAVSASDATSASVTAADGRVFATSDGGVTWAAR